MQDQLHVDVLISNPPSAGVSPSNTTTSTPCHNLSQHMTVPSSGTVASRLKKMVHACNGTSPRCENGYTVWNADGLNIQRFPSIKYDRADNELLRIIAQYLKTIGLSETVKVLTLESGCTIENPLATKFREEVLTGDWSSAMESLEGLSNFVAKPWHIVEMRFLILERKYLELYESGRAVDALMVLRKELMPLRYNKERLQELACLLMDCTRCVGTTMPNWETITSARNALMDRLQKYLPASVILPPRRLEALIHQAIELQWKKCLYHNIAGEPSLRRLGNDSLLLDHVCPDTDFPYETTQILTDHSDEVWFCRFSNSGKRLATGSKDGIVFIWEVDSTTRRLTKLFALEGHVFGASYFAWSPDDELLAVVGSEESADLWIWKMSDGTLHKKVTHSPDESISCVSWHSDGLRMVCGGTRGQFYLTDVEGNIVETWEGIRVRVAHCKHDGRNVLAADTHNRIRNYCFDDLTERTVIKEDASLMYFCIDKSERYALCSVAQQGLHLWDLETGTLVRRYRGGGQGYYTIFSCFGGANERYLASGSEEGNVYVWQRESEEAILVLKGHNGVVNAACWNPADPSMLASCSDDGTVRIWGPVVRKDNTPNDGCQRHVDCADRRSLCFATQCIRAKPLPSFGVCEIDANCRRNHNDLRQHGRGCKFSRCHEIIGTPGSKSCNFQEECKGQSVCIQYHCVAAEPTEHTCHSGAQCGVGERCISGMCFRPISKRRRHQLYPHEYNELAGFGTAYGPAYSQYDQMYEDSQDGYFPPRFASYEPPPIPQCSGVEICPAMCCTVTCAQAACCCQATYFNYY